MAKKMTVTLLSPISGPNISYVPGDEVSLPVDEAKTMIERGHAECRDTQEDLEDQLVRLALKCRAGLITRDKTLTVKAKAAGVRTATGVKAANG